MAKKKDNRGRPPKDPPEKMYFGIKCTEAERKQVMTLINQEGAKTGARITHSDFFLKLAGVR